MEAAKKHLEEESKKRKQQTHSSTGQRNPALNNKTAMAKQPSAQRVMNSSGSSFKAP